MFLPLVPPPRLSAVSIHRPPPVPGGIGALDSAATAALPSHPPITATIAICTYRRPQLLRETLRCLVRQEYARDRCEILVVDNNSPDDSTRRVVDSFAHAPIAPQYLLEPRQGLSHARNRALAASMHDVIVYVDDDVIVEPDWLQTLLRPFQHDPEQRIAVVGGEVIPVFPEGIAAWGWPFYSPLRLRATCGPVKPGEIPMGANLAFRRQLLVAAGQFDPGVGRSGAALLAGDENRPVERLRQGGHEVWFAPEARAFHQMPRSRTTLRYVLRHGFDSARSRVITQMGAFQDAKRSPLPYLASRLFVNALKLVVYGVQGLVLSLLLQRQGAVPALVRACRACGYIRQTSTLILGHVTASSTRRIHRWRTRPRSLRAGAAWPRR
jgi:glucosyl-dolichyl phosphate glucuronosyltransferase